MTPEQIDAVTNGLISLEHFVDTYGLGIGVIAASTAALWGAGRIWQRIEDRRRLRRTPAAFDNVQPHDIDALITCRRIAALHPADPAIWRQADNYHRQKGDEQP